MVKPPSMTFKLENSISMSTVLECRQSQQKMTMAADKKVLWVTACVACRRNDVFELLKCLNEDSELLIRQNDGSYLAHVAFEAGFAETCHALLGFARRKGETIVKQENADRKLLCTLRSRKTELTS